jgi:prepilin-type N-terminal cleavage/methylation domain-containing protein
VKALRPPQVNRQSGFSLVELTIVVVILGVLSMMAVPKYQTSVERVKSAEAFQFLAEIQGAQESFNARTGQYAHSVRDLDLKFQPPQHFRVGSITSYDWQTKWELRLFREGSSGGFGNYSVTWNQDGFTRYRSSLSEDLVPVL